MHTVEQLNRTLRHPHNGRCDIIEDNYHGSSLFNESFVGKVTESDASFD